MKYRNGQKISTSYGQVYRLLHTLLNLRKKHDVIPTLYFMKTYFTFAFIMEGTLPNLNTAFKL